MNTHERHVTTPGAQFEFRSEEKILIPESGHATPYPSIVEVTGLKHKISKITVTLIGLEHSFLSDISILLVGPKGDAVVLMSRVGAGIPFNGSLLLDDEGTEMPQYGQVRPSSKYRPTNHKHSDFFPSPAPVGPFADELAAFNGTDPNGKWALYINDEIGPNSGCIDGGWTLTIVTSSDLAGLNEDPTSGLVIRGGSLNFSAIASSDEAALDVHALANVICKLLRSADTKDMCLGLFGGWGRGKSFLAEQITATIGRLNIPDANYVTTRFSAWQFPNRPEVWVYLYEAICSTLGPLRFRTLAFTILTGIQLYGSRGLWFALIGLTVTLWPKNWLLQLTADYLKHYEFAAAAGILLYLILTLLKFWRTCRHLHRSYFTQVRHREKLGLQAAIGRDLKALLKGHIQANPRHEFARWRPKFYCSMALLLSLVLWRFWGNWPAVASLGIPLILLTPLVELVFRYATPAPSRLLLIVDDLDRCSWDHLLNVIESIKLLLEDEDISRRVQVMMLVEEDVLKHALWEKYKFLTDATAKPLLRTAFDAQRIVADNFGKLFTVQLRLTPLKMADIVDLVNRFGAATGGTPNGTARVTVPSPSLPPDVARNDTSTRTISKDSDAFDPILDSSTSLNWMEKSAVLSAIRSTQNGNDETFSPRSLRSLLFRYQLARLLLDESGYRNFDPETLTSLIIERTRTGMINRSPTSKIENAMIAVANQVG